MIVRRFVRTAALGLVIVQSRPDFSYSVWHCGVELGRVSKLQHGAWIVVGSEGEIFSMRRAALEVLATRHRAGELLAAADRLHPFSGPVPDAGEIAHSS